MYQLCSRTAQHYPLSGNNSSHMYQFCSLQNIIDFPVTIRTKGKRSKNRKSPVNHLFQKKFYEKFKKLLK